MRILHLADFHLGKLMDGHNLLPYQQEVLLQGVADIVSKQSCDVLLICGDIFEDIYPDDVAMCVFNSFLTKVRPFVKDIIICAGNHDNSAIFEFLSSFLEGSHVHCFGQVRTQLSKVTLFDEQGPVNFYILPFLKAQFLTSFAHPLLVQGATAVFLSILNASHLNPEERNVLVAHQYFYSFEEARKKKIVTVKQPDMIDVTALEAFDFVFAGHVHEPTKVNDRVVYSGSPYPMHYTDRSEKCASVVELGAKGEVRREFVSIDHHALQIRVYKTTMRAKSRLPPNNNDFVYVLFDQDVVPKAVQEELASKYPKFCRTIGKTTELKNDLFSKTTKERNVENYDSSGIAGKIGEDLTDKDSLFLTTLFAKIKRHFKL